MILLRQACKIFTTIGLVAFISVAMAFGFLSGESLANSLSPTTINQPYVSAVTMDRIRAMAKDIEGKAQEGIGNITGDLENQAAGKVKQFEASTQEAILESIDNPNYQPGGQNKLNREAVECLKDDVRDCFNQK